MKNYLNRLPKNLRDLVYSSGEVAKKLNLRIYLVGGIVRDLILGKQNFDLESYVKSLRLVYDM